MIETIAIIVILFAVAIAIYAASRPNQFRIERSIVIDAPAQKIYPLIADFRNWRQWSPWEELDPGLERTYEGAPHGVGAIYSYSGGPKVGAARMEIIEAQPPRHVAAKLDFIRPVRARNRCEWTLVPEGSGTLVIWAVTGPQSFFSKLAGLLVSMDKMIGGLFEDGLSRLKSVAEAK